MTTYFDPSVDFFYNCPTRSLTLLANSFISDFISLGKSFVNIKKNKILVLNPERHRRLYSVFQNNCYQFLLL